MFKLNLLIFITVFLTVTNGQEKLANNNTNNSTLRTEDYINLNRQQYAKNIQAFDAQIEIFEKLYAAGLETINIQRDMLISTLLQNEDKLKPLQVLSDLSKKCVNKYSSSIPTTADTKRKMTSCYNSAMNKVSNMLVSALYTRNYLDSYYNNNFEKKIATCKSNYNNLPLNYTLCVTDVVSNTDELTANEQKTFSTQMDAVQCTGNANIKKALDCSYTIESDALSAITEANTLINKCLLGQDDCKQCSQGYTCSEVTYLNQSEVDYNSPTMNNPFYRRYTATECLLLKLI